MKILSGRKLTWVICIVGILLAVVSEFFLPEIIPIHFVNGIADEFGNKTKIFLAPVLLLIIAVLSGREKIKYYLTHSKTFKTDDQYNMIINCVLGIIMITEIYVIYASLV